MADDFNHEGFYNYNYDQQQQQSYGYDMGGNNFGQDQQFAQFDYGQQGYGDPNMYGGQKDQYVGSILTPDPTPAYDASTGGENYDDEPPLMEELGINFDHITQKNQDGTLASPFSDREVPKSHTAQFLEDSQEKKRNLIKHNLAFLIKSSEHVKIL